MPDQTMSVSFTAPDTWSFDPPMPTMTGSGKVKLKQADTNQNWTFDSVAFDNDSSHQFTPEPPSDNGKKLDIDDAHTADGTYSFTITVTTADGTKYTSPDPKIVNEDPPIPGPVDL